MHTLVRMYVKTGVGFLAYGVVLGVYMLIRRELAGEWPHPYLVSAHAHALLAGFMLFLVFGVALWLFPRAAKDDERYTPEAVRVAYWVLCVATVLRVGAETARGWMDGRPLSWAIVIGGVGQAIGIALYFRAMWGRIRPVGSHVREARGERF